MLTQRPVAGVGKDKNKTLRGLRQRYQPSFSKGFADRITLHILSPACRTEFCGEIVETGREVGNL